MPRKKRVPLRNAVLDFETDPFKYGRVPKPFCCDIYDGEKHVEFWGPDCVARMVDYLHSLKEPLRLYAHNGGKFDFFMMLEHLENPIKLINGRIVKVKCGIHELRDSYAIMPIPLSAYHKDEINYDHFEAETRENYKDEILRYLRSDCTYLYELVSAFWARFGDKLTVGSTAIGKLREYHPFDSQGESHDKTFRPFYFGGRVEAFETGVLKGDFSVFDVNSMYPYVMSEFHHPTGHDYNIAYSGIVDKKGRISGFANSKFFFAVIECEQQGAFPTRVKDGPLDFNVPFGEFFVTSHELQSAVATGRVQRIKVRKVLAPSKTIQFKDYVATYMAEKVAAKNSGDKIGELFAKLLLNSAYGKFGSNPENYKDFYIQRAGIDPAPEEPYCLEAVHEGGIYIWSQPTPIPRYFDVATAASITGAARSVLLRALSASKRAVYCDTDSIICERFEGELDSSRLGAWKLEGRGDALAIAGKKLYALRSAGKDIKRASKGVLLTSAQLFDIAGGASVHWYNDAPSFSLTPKAKGYKARFVDRKIQSTAKRSALA